MKNINSAKTGFTLIELLVVVVIIAILAAVALPRYQLAVAKSRMSEGLIVLKNIKQAVDRYELANNKKPESFKDLDIDLPNCGADFKSCSSNAVNYRIDTSNGCIFATLTGRDLFLERNLGDSILWCSFKTADSFGKRVCEAITDNGPVHHTNGTNSYIIVSKTR